MASQVASRPSGSGPLTGTGKSRKPKKTYSHEMSEQEKFAVAVVMQARKACGLLIDSIRSGNGASGPALQACSVVASQAASIAFAEKRSE